MNNREMASLSPDAGNSACEREKCERQREANHLDGRVVMVARAKGRFSDGCGSWFTHDG
jgi:hypothetical protein